MKFAQNALAHMENPQRFSLSARTASEDTPAAGSCGILSGAPVLAPLVLRIVPSCGYPRLASLLWIARVLSRATLPSSGFPPTDMALLCYTPCSDLAQAFVLELVSFV